MLLIAYISFLFTFALLFERKATIILPFALLENALQKHCFKYKTKIVF